MDSGYCEEKRSLGTRSGSKGPVDVAQCSPSLLGDLECSPSSLGDLECLPSLLGDLGLISPNYENKQEGKQGDRLAPPTDPQSCNSSSSSGSLCRHGDQSLDLGLF